MARGFWRLVRLSAIIRLHDHHWRVRRLAGDGPAERLLALVHLLDFQHLHVLLVGRWWSDRYVRRAVRPSKSTTNVAVGPIFDRYGPKHLLVIGTIGLSAAVMILSVSKGV